MVICSNIEQPENCIKVMILVFLTTDVLWIPLKVSCLPAKTNVKEVLPSELKVFDCIKSPVGRVHIDYLCPTGRLPALEICLLHLTYFCHLCLAPHWVWHCSHLISWSLITGAGCVSVCGVKVVLAGSLHNYFIHPSHSQHSQHCRQLPELRRREHSETPCFISHTVRSSDSTHWTRPMLEEILSPSYSQQGDQRIEKETNVCISESFVNSAQLCIRLYIMRSNVCTRF